MVIEPAATGVVEPTPLLMKPSVVFELVHERTADSPGRTRVADVVSVHAGPGGASTMTVSVQVTVPPGPVAVPVYVVVFCGVRLPVVPPETGVTELIP